MIKFTLLAPSSERRMLLTVCLI